MDKVLFIGKVWPEPQSSAAGTRMLQLIQSFTDRNVKVYFGSAADRSAYSADLPASVEIFPVLLNDPAFDEAIRNLRPSAVVFDRFTTEEQFGWRIAENFPEALRILDTEDLHCLRAARMTALEEGRDLKTSDLHNETAFREIASILRCDLSLIISAREMTLLQDFYKVDESQLCYLPFLFDRLSPHDTSGWRSFQQRDNFISIGNFLHAPNLDAARFLRNDIWPLIRKRLPDAQLYLFGSYGTKEAEQWHNPAQGLFYKGRAEDSASVISSARVLLAPLRAGAGLKGKLAEAMAQGTPSVTTTIGMEGMGEAAKWPGAIADTAAGFADAANELYTSGIKWNQAQKKCLPAFNALFHKAEHEERLMNRINEIAEELEHHRSRNFTGAMLMHHSAHSRRWLAKYIEAKNNKAGLIDASAGTKSTP
jgi:hypothetical protein